MQYLIDFAAEDREFERVLRRAADYGTVQGIVLDIDRMWLRLWTFSTKWGERWIERFDERYFDVDPYFSPLSGRFEPRPEPAIFAKPLDRDTIENWRPDHFAYRRLVERRRSDFPIIVKVCLRPRLTPDDVYPTVSDLTDPEGRLEIELETRSIAQLSSNPRKKYNPLPGGVSIGVGPTDFGTLGVMLTDGHGTRYGLTCAHVAGAYTFVQQPSGRDSRSPAVLGRTVTTSTLVPCPPGSPCNPWSGALPNEVDASLIEIDAGRFTTLMEVLDIGALSGVMPRASITTTQTIEVMGRTSSMNVMQVGGLAAWYRFNANGTEYCFKNLFEVESPYGTSGIIRPGDSGAPVCAAGAQGTEWAGMINGRDMFKGYAIYAETLEQWLVSSGHALTVA